MSQEADSEKPAQSPPENFKARTYEDIGGNSSADKAYNSNSEADHWKIPVDFWIEQEKEKCAAWKAEVENLLIFSGLFSAVVTGLLVESHKSLQLNTSEVLLAQIASNLVSLANSSTPTPTSLPEGTPPFTPSSRSVRVNALWFLSLILSLATALVCIITQQWLREHLRPSPRNVSPRVLPGLLHMQAEALDQYWVPQIFIALPLLLITGLVLFLVGMIEFLWNLNKQVAIPGIIGISFVFAFLIYTTVRPGLHSLPLYTPLSPKKSPSIPCPYRSPQAWIFLQFAALAHIVTQPLFFVARLISALVQLKSSPLPAFSLVESIKFDWRLLVKSITANLGYGRKSWINHATLWLSQRDIDLLSHRHGAAVLLNPYLELDPYDQQIFPWYDGIKALKVVERTFISTGNIKLSAVYKCLNEFTDPRCHAHMPRDHTRTPDPTTRDARNYITEFAKYIYSIIPGPFIPQNRFAYILEVLPQIDPSSPVALVVDTIQLTFMKNSPGYYHIEKGIRVISWTIDHIEGECDDSHVTSLALFCQYLDHYNNDFGLEIPRQIFHLLQTFFSRTSSLHPSQDELGKKLYVTRYVHELLRPAAKLLRTTHSEALCLRHNELLFGISNKIFNRTASDYLFATATYYASEIEQSPFQHEGLLQALSKQKARFKDPFILAMLSGMFSWNEDRMNQFIATLPPSESDNNTPNHDQQTPMPQSDVISVNGSKSEGLEHERRTPSVQAISEELVNPIEIQASQQASGDALIESVGKIGSTAEVSETLAQANAVVASVSELTATLGDHHGGTAVIDMPPA